MKGVDKKGEKSLIHAIPKEHKLHPFFLADSEPISHICLTREYFVVIKEPASDPKSKTITLFTFTRAISSNPCRFLMTKILIRVLFGRSRGILLSILSRFWLSALEKLQKWI